MTKDEALQKIKELSEYIENMDKVKLEDIKPFAVFRNSNSNRNRIGDNGYRVLIPVFNLNEGTWFRLTGNGNYSDMNGLGIPFSDEAVSPEQMLKYVQRQNWKRVGKLKLELN